MDKHRYDVQFEILLAGQTSAITTFTVTAPDPDAAEMAAGIRAHKKGLAVISTRYVIRK